MKHIKKLDEDNKMKIVNFSDMDGTWDPKQFKEKEQLTGKKDIDSSLGQRIRNFLQENNIYVSVGPGDYCKKNRILLPDEKNFKEYRVELGKKQDYKEWLEWNAYEDSLESREDYDNSEIDYDNSMQWSVFLPTSVTVLESAALTESVRYLKMIKSTYPGIINSQLDYYDALRENVKAFKLFINENKVSITNDNLELVDVINFRLYKDSKVFAYFIDELGRKKSEMIINNLLKIS